MSPTDTLLAALLAISPLPAGCSKPSGDRAVDAGGAPSSRPAAFTCAVAADVVVDGKSTGYERCVRDGTFLRTNRAVSCPVRAPDLSARCDDSPCRAAVDCPQRNAYCGRNMTWDPLMGLGSSECVCKLGCSTDADCAPDEACFCDPVNAGTPVRAPAPAGACVRASCRGDADCGGRPCYASPVARPGLPPVMGFACASDADACATDTDCPDHLACMIVDNGRACRVRYVDGRGRPLVVGSGLRVAMLSGARGWC